MALTELAPTGRLGSAEVELHRGRTRVTVYAPGLVPAAPEVEAPPTAPPRQLKGRQLREAQAAARE